MVLLCRRNENNPHLLNPNQPMTTWMTDMFDGRARQLSLDYRIQQPEGNMTWHPANGTRYDALALSLL